ncbi:MAG: hypothetical protein WD002_00340 [Pseudomonadales bacterium]
MASSKAAIYTITRYNMPLLLLIGAKYGYRKPNQEAAPARLSMIEAGGSKKMAGNQRRIVSSRAGKKQAFADGYCPYN